MFVDVPEQLVGTERSDNRSFARGLTGSAVPKFWGRVALGYAQAYRLLFRTLRQKKCYIGPFKGEFGNFLGHVAPFLMYLHLRGVKITYCGLELFQPVLVDETGSTIVADFRPLRDFFSEVKPNANVNEAPEDVERSIGDFVREAESSNLPFWNLGDTFFYWNIFRNWLPKGPYTHVYRLEEVYGNTSGRNAVTLFPRKANEKRHPNQGDSWDYSRLLDILSQHMDHVFVTGHVEFTEKVASPRENVIVSIGRNNRSVLEQCSASRLIVTQHSGAVYLGEYTHCDVLILYRGPLPIGSLINTLRFKKTLGSRSRFHYAFSYEDVEKFIKEYGRSGNDHEATGN